MDNVNFTNNLFAYDGTCVFGDSSNLTATDKVIEDEYLTVNIYGGSTNYGGYNMAMGRGSAITTIYGSSALNVLDGEYYVSIANNEYFIGAGWGEGANVTIYGNSTVTLGVLNASNSDLIVGSVDYVEKADILGGGQGYIYGSTSVVINSGTFYLYGSIVGGSCWGGEIYGDSYVTINGGDITAGNIYGGNFSKTAVDGDSWVTINAGTVNANIVAGGAGYNAYTEGDAWIDINGGVISGTLAAGITNDLNGDDDVSTTSLNFNVSDEYTIYASITTSVINERYHYWFDEINFNGKTVTFANTDNTITTADFSDSQLNFVFDASYLDETTSSYSFIKGSADTFSYERTISYSITYDSETHEAATDDSVDTYTIDYETYYNNTTFTITYSNATDTDSGVATVSEDDTDSSSTSDNTTTIKVFNLRIYQIAGQDYIINADDDEITTYQVTVDETTLYVNSTDYADYVSGDWISGDSYVTGSLYYDYNAFASFDEIQALFATAESANTVTEEIVLANDFILTNDEEDSAKYFYTNSDVELSGAGALTIQPSDFYFTSSLTDSELSTMTISVDVDATSSTLYVSNLDLAISNGTTVSSASFDIDDDAQLSLTVGSTLEYSSSFNNAGTIDIDLTDASESVSIYKVIDYTGEDYDSVSYGEITLSDSSSYYTVVHDGDLYVTNADDKVAYVSEDYNTDADGNSYSFGDVFEGNNDIGLVIYGINAFGKDVEYDFTFEKVVGGAIVDDKDTAGYYCKEDIVVDLNSVEITKDSGRVYTAGMYYYGTNVIESNVSLNITGSTTAEGTIIYGAGLVYDYTDDDTNDTRLTIKGSVNVTIDSVDGIFKEIYGGGAVINGGYLEIGGAVNVTINSGTFTSFVGTGTKCFAGTVNVYGGTNLTISGGNFQSIVYAGSYSQGGTATVKGDCTTTISGGTFGADVYGGSISSSSSVSSSSIIDGNVIMTIKSNSDNKIVFNADIYVGSHGYGTISGSATITFTGSGSNLTFASNSSVYGECSSGAINTGITKGSYLIFNAFEGNFDAGLGYFNNIEITNGSSVVITGAADDAVALSSISSWTFVLEADTTALTLLDDDTGITNDFTGDNFILEFSASDFDEIGDMLTVLDAQTADALAGFEKLSSVTMIIDGVSQTTTSQDNGAWICGDYSFSIDDNDSSNLVVKLA